MTKPDLQPMAIEIGRQAAEYPARLPADLRASLATALAIAVHPYLEMVWELAEAGWSGRLCACGCGQPVTGRRPDAKYATGACRVRASRGARNPQ